MKAPENWWDDPEALHRFVTSVIAAELTRTRPGESLPPRPWPPTLKIGAGGLDADSLELLTLAAGLGQSLHIHRSGLEDLLLARRTVGDWVAIAGQSLARFSEEISFQTSGSTGDPKFCVHAIAELEEEATALASVIGARTRIVAAVPCHHIYGFIFTVLLPCAMGAPVLDFMDRSVLGLSAQLRPGDLVVGHPELWRAAARVTPEFPADVVGVTSTAPCDPAVLRDLRAHGMTRIIEVYGSSETAGIGWRDDPGEPYWLFAHWRRGKDESEIIRQGLAAAARAVLLCDRLEWRGSDRFLPLGRLDGAVQVGGINVFPARVAAALAKHPAISDVAVRLMKPGEGTRLKAFIVPREPETDLEALRSEIKAWISENMSVAERPKALRFGPQIPTSPMGKPTDWGLD